MLGKTWIRELIEDGYWKSPTATGFATMPPAVDHICKRLGLDTLKDGDIIVEIGPGPGPMPQTILRAVRNDIQYIAIELNGKFAGHLKKEIRDPRLTVLNDNALQIGSISREMRMKARLILSSMPFSSDQSLTESILNQSRDEVLREDGQLLMWNFNPSSVIRVLKAFGRENCTLRGTPLNFPPLLTVLANKPTEIEGDDFSSAFLISDGKELSGRENTAAFTP